jgi:Type I phosphodiesterase / nucleotide pyrophosphatase
VRRRLSIAICVALVVAAGAAAQTTQTTSTPLRPSLIVVISVDQMRADYLDRFRPWFGKDGFNRFLERGAVWPEARHRYASTYTAPGHASIGTGVDPRTHGIVLNRWYDAVAGEPVYCTEDRRGAWVGPPPEAPKIPILPASPLYLDGDSLGDRLKEKFPGARVIGVALKDRAAVLMAGRKADAAIWFEERFARFVTSTYYPPHPELLGFNASLPAFFEESAHRTWDLSGRIPAADLDRITFDPPELFGTKDQPASFGPTFPHALGSASDVTHSPWGDDLVLGLARAVVDVERLGSADGRPDLLFIGLSSTDYYGHWFGPDSKEIADGIVRLDGKLETFFRWLDGKIGAGRVLLFLTADHGVQPIPQVALARRRKRGEPEDPLAAGRVDFSNGRGTGQFPLVRELSKDRVALEEILAKKFGYALDSGQPAVREAAVVFFDEPCLYVNRPVLARRGLDVEAVKLAVREWARTRPGVEAAWTNTEIVNGLPATAPHALEIARSFRADRSGDVVTILRPGWMWSYGREKGTTHGQPNDDDARVPLLAWGPGVRAGKYPGRVSPISIARTVAALLGFEAGAPDADVLEPVLGRDTGVKKPMAARP